MAHYFFYFIWPSSLTVMDLSNVQNESLFLKKHISDTEAKLDAKFCDVR